MRLEPIHLYNYEARAKQVLPHNVWDFIDAGAMDKTTTRRNRTAFEALTLRPRRYPQVGSRPGEHSLRMGSGEDGPIGNKHRHA